MRVHEKTVGKFRENGLSSKWIKALTRYYRKDFAQFLDVVNWPSDRSRAQLNSLCKTELLPSIPINTSVPTVINMLKGKCKRNENSIFHNNVI